MDSNIEQILDVGFSPPKNSQNLSLEDAMIELVCAFRCCE
jgi:hypothetical protein